MANIGYYVCVPFALLTKWFYEVTGSYGVALILFTLVVKLLILPFQIKSKKSMIRMNRMQGKMKDIQVRYANDKQKQQEAIADLYAQEGINPMSGCLWSFLPLPVLIILYSIIRKPLRNFMLIAEEGVKEISALATKLGLILPSGTNANAYEQIYIAKFVHNNWSDFASLAQKYPRLIDLDYNFLGMDLSQVAKDVFGESGLAGGWPVIGLCLLPFIAAGLQFLMSFYTTKTNPNQEVNSSSKAMLIMFPLMTVWMGFILPGALCVYWIANAAFSAIQEVVMNKFFNNKLDAEETEAERIKREERIAKYEKQKAIAAEQKAAMDKKNTKPKPVKASGEKKEAGTNENGRIDNRPYARGRSYDEKHYED